MAAEPAATRRRGNNLRLVPLKHGPELLDALRGEKVTMCQPTQSDLDDISRLMLDAELDTLDLLPATKPPQPSEVRIAREYYDWLCERVDTLQREHAAMHYDHNVHRLLFWVLIAGLVAVMIWGSL